MRAVHSAAVSDVVDPDQPEAISLLALPEQLLHRILGRLSAHDGSIASVLMVSLSCPRYSQSEYAASCS